MLRLYLYLASRDKRGIKLVTILQSAQPVNASLTDLGKLRLPQVWETQIRRIIYDNRILYEPRLETARSYNDLKAKLVNRGFRDLPMGATPALNLSQSGSLPKANTSECGVCKKMLQRKKD